MDKTFLISMLVTFVTSNDVLKFEPKNPADLHLDGSLPSGVTGQWNKPKFCKKLDCPEYQVVSSTEDYEERIYSTSNWVSTNLTGLDYNTAQYTMFMKLFKYISGANEKKIKIDMTVPVTNRIIPGQGPACESDFIMSFFISSSVAEAPKPSSDDVYLNTKDEMHVFVGQFGGYAMTYDTWRKQAQKLGAALDKAGLSYEQDFYYTAGYDSPYTLFNRHNEVWFFKK